MEGPTPVSSLIHAATMVTAGIFIILRFSNLFIISNYGYSILLLIGSITLFFSATIGISQIDIKKIVAYSTCSQLGYMFLSCGFFGFNHTFFHLFIHAFFKALLFLTAGYIIHLLSNEQDLRKMGGLLKVAPLSYTFIIIASYALVGLPFISGFYSKESLIEFIVYKVFNSFSVYINIINIAALVFSFITVVLTLLYSLKSIFDIYYFEYRGFKNYIKNLYFSTIKTNLPLIVLCFSSIYFGFIFNELFIGLNTTFIGFSLSVHTKIPMIITEYYPYFRVFVIVFIMYFMVLFGIIKIYTKNFFYIFLKNNSKFYDLYYVLSKKYLYINRLFFYKTFFNFVKQSYNFVYLFFDKGIIEVIGPYGIVYKLYNCIRNFQNLQSGYIYHHMGYIFIILIIVIFYIIYMFF
jgi:NADH:ubiquinone oxidoreductase subunit 5 (subunit L)/multisubunit Na+/H+ antiporter MnhA subunit